MKKMWNADNGDGTYTNPILYTDYSDPDVIRVEEDYYMVASSFCNVPSVPVLHSRDLVNWKVISYCIEKLPFDYYDIPMHGCGSWAPAIRFHEGYYYVFIPMPDEGIFMCKTNDPFKGWEEPVCVKKARGWIDPCPFWDDDGKAYMVNAFAKSRIGFNGILHVSPMMPDCMNLLDEGVHVFDGHETQPTIEGPKLYKRNGYYYIFAPAGGVQTGWQTVLRSQNIYGPYDEKIVLHQGNTEINGPHQGAWVDTPSGEDWFIHFQDVGNAGRIIHLQPMHWIDDWPVIGINADENGCGEPVITYRKPEVGRNYEPCSPEDSDDFTGDKLGLQWQWNANYKDDWYCLKDNCLTLYSRQVNPVVQLCDVSNLLLQKWPAPEFMITAKLDIRNLVEGDCAGMISLGGVYTALVVKVESGKCNLAQNIGEWNKSNETEKIYHCINSDFIYLRMIVRKEEMVSYAYSIDGEHYETVGETVSATPGRWVGVKAGLFAVNKSKISGGALKVDCFLFEQIC